MGTISSRVSSLHLDRKFGSNVVVVVSATCSCCVRLYNVCENSIQKDLFQTLGVLILCVTLCRLLSESLLHILASGL